MILDDLGDLDELDFKFYFSGLLKLWLVPLTVSSIDGSWLVPFGLLRKYIRSQILSKTNA